jgi:hypothetical protein
MRPGAVEKMQRTNQLAREWVRGQLERRFVARGYDRRHDYQAEWSVEEIRARVLAEAWNAPIEEAA